MRMMAAAFASKANIIKMQYNIYAQTPILYSDTNYYSMHNVKLQLYAQINTNKLKLYAIDLIPKLFLKFHQMMYIQT